MANYDLFIFHGHGGADCGATGNGYIEVERAKILVDKVVSLLSSNGLKVHTNNGTNNYYENLTKNNTYNYKLGYSIHLNSGGGTGAEIIVPINESELSLDFNILYELEKIGFKNRGVKSRDYDTELFTNRESGKKIIGYDYYKEVRDGWENGTSLGILEVCFIDNKNDIELFNKNIDNIACAIAKQILDYCDMDIKPQTPVQANKLYRVQVGAFKDKANADKLAQELKQKGYNVIIV